LFQIKIFWFSISFLSPVAFVPRKINVQVTFLIEKERHKNYKAHTLDSLVHIPAIGLEGSSSFAFLFLMDSVGGLEISNSTYIVCNWIYLYEYFLVSGWNIITN